MSPIERRQHHTHIVSFQSIQGYKPILRAHHAQIRRVDAAGWDNWRAYDDQRRSFSASYARQMKTPRRCSSTKCTQRNIVHETKYPHSRDERSARRGACCYCPTSSRSTSLCQCVHGASGVDDDASSAVVYEGKRPSPRCMPRIKLTGNTAAQCSCGASGSYERTLHS